ncbi:VanW family protein [Desnuesiella massiliensis]|uniref:VanW family protein n=1 Tax=Desnuesiella massiliensis TaxID=1650662 RepID=UPI0006E415EB|nr:VanW family protein [Desnuesiella massiliensis]
MRKRRLKKKFPIILLASILTIIAVATSAYMMYIYKETSKWDNLAYPGVKIEGLDLGGKNEEQIKSILKDKYGDAILKKQLSVNQNNKSYNMDYSKLNSKYNIDEVAKEAIAYGKEQNMLSKYKNIKNSFGKELILKFDYDPKYIKEFIASIAKNINKEPVNATIKSNNGKFDITNDIKGYKLDEEALEKKILDSINGDIKQQTVIDAPIKAVEASVTADKLRTINAKIATFSTNYASSNWERAYNVELATKAINGKVLMPGETFSYNDVVGERTVEKGYKDAPVIVGNKVESGLGGGICQVSSTLYQAVLRTGLKSVERINHSLQTSYLGLGLDATVVFGALDYKFKNTFDFPIYIEGITQNRVVYFNIYGSGNINNRSYQIIPEVYQTIPANVKTVDDPNLPEGQTVVEKNAVNGYKVKVYRKTYEGEKLISTETLSNDYYLPVEGIIKKGTKKAETPPQNPLPPKQP